MYKEEDQTTDIEVGEAKDTLSEQQEKSQDDNNLRSLCDKIKCKNIQVIGVPEGEQEVEDLFEEIMMENFPNLVKEIERKAQEEQGAPHKMSPKRPTARHMIKMTKVKDKKRILKIARKKLISQ